MNDLTKGAILFSVGAVLTLIAFVKFSIIGFYPNEAIGFLIVLALGSLGLWGGSRMYVRGKQAAATAAVSRAEEN